MLAAKKKIRSHAPNGRRSVAMRRNNGKVFNERQIIELIEAYQAMGKMLEQLVGRERLYWRQFINGLERALHDVAIGRTQEVKSFEDFSS